MEDHTDNPPAKPRKPRRKRPHGRWTNPGSPLQAARFAHKLSGKTVVVGIRTLCEGHGDEDCKIDVSKVSDYETRNRRPGLDHMTALCKFYVRHEARCRSGGVRDPPPGCRSSPGEAEGSLVPGVRKRGGKQP